MTLRRLGRTALLVLGACFLAALALPLTARPAAACLVSYDYRPTIKIDLRHPGSGLGKPCDSSTSYTGVFVVAALAFGALGAAAARSVKRGQTLSGSFSTYQTNPLTSYLRAATSPPLPSNQATVPDPTPYAPLTRNAPEPKGPFYGQQWDGGRDPRPWG